MFFSKEWFLKHQKLLLWFANLWIARKILYINGDRSAVGKNKIFKILPNAIFWKGKGKKIIAEFRTHDKFAKRLYYAFRPIWYLFHAWDTLFANIFQPAWNLGFDTLTVFPDANPETTTVDGLVARDVANPGEVWGTIRAGAGIVAGPSDTTNTVPFIDSSTTTDQWNTIQRAIVLFDTSSLGAGATEISATLSLFGNAKNDDLVITPNINIYGATPASNTDLVAADYGQLGSTAYSTAVTFAGFSTTAYNDFAFNATGNNNISLTGVSKFGVQNANYDVANVAPAWSSNVTSGMAWYLADRAGTIEDPKLVVTYTPGGNDDFTIIF